MKKMLKSIITLAAAVAAFGFFASCGSGGDDDYSDPVPSGKIWDNATIIEEMEGKSVSWGKEVGTDIDAIQVPAEVCGKLQVGSKVIFQLDKYDSGDGDGAYLKFQVTQGGWNACGVDKYYNAKGRPIPVVENKDNKGVYESDTTTPIEPGTWYFEVTEANVKTLRAGFGFQGRLTLVKLGITDLLDEVYDPDKEIELTEPAEKEGYLRFWAQKSALEEGKAMLVLSYESEVLNAAVKLFNVDIEYILNDGDAQHYTKDVKLPKNTYGTDYQAKVDILPSVTVKKNDVLYVKVTAKVDNENAEDIIMANLIDTSAGATPAYFGQLCRQDEEGTENGIFEQGQIITTGITYAVPEEKPATTEEVVLVSEETKLDWNTNVSFDVSELNVGDKIQFVLKQDVSDKNECQFIDSSWAFGKDIITITCVTDGTNYMYYAEEGTTNRPSVHPSTTQDLTFEIVVTKGFIDKGTVSAVGTATLLSAKVIPASN